jgi:hypothetical protein
LFAIAVETLSALAAKAATANDAAMRVSRFLAGPAVAPGATQIFSCLELPIIVSSPRGACRLAAPPQIGYALSPTDTSICTIHHFAG